jgi:hypothetical protein
MIVGFTTVGKIRTMGYEVVHTSGDAYRATVVVPEYWSTDAASELARMVERAANPARELAQRRRTIAERYRPRLAAT